MPNPRKPKKTKIIHGTFRKDRNPKREPEPEVVSNIPKPPSNLPLQGKKLWKSLAAELVDKGLLTIVDLGALEVCCFNYGLYKEFDKSIRIWIIDPVTGKRRRRSYSEYIEGQNSQTVPGLLAMYKAFSIYKSYLVEFGLTPASRNRIELPEPKRDEKDPIKRMWNEE